MNSDQEMTKENDFQTDFLFPDEEKDFIAEINFRNKCLCILRQDSGFESLDIEFFPPDMRRGKPHFKFKLAAFEEAIARAKKRLWELRKE